MKKTNRTLLTAAVLTAAAAMRPDTAVNLSAQTSYYTTPVYGPPSSFSEPGDVNCDNKVNVLDFCLLKSKVLGISSDKADVYSDKGDMNNDGEVNARDVMLLKNFFNNINDYIDVTQPVYGTYPVNTTTTLPVTSVQPVYGTTPVITQPNVPYFTTTNLPDTTVETKYGTPPALWDDITQPEYGTYPAYEYENKEEMVTKVPDSENNEEIVTTVPDSENEVK